MAGSCSPPAAPPWPLPAPRALRRMAMGEGAVPGRIAIGLRGTGGLGAAIGGNPVGQRAVLQPAAFPLCSILLGFQGFGRAGDAAPGGGRGAEPRFGRAGAAGPQERENRCAHPRCGEHTQHLSCSGHSSFLNCSCARSREYPEMGDRHCARVMNYTECEKMTRTPVTVLARQGSGELESAGVHLHEGKKH
ncbi:lactosylceramide 1,3-N-acetyl-beta-D-glucosaminyltransferase isoform X3 [Oenanthe melanoleuca]|uniref:lactosylceramide 1,3-N-acetyl-beta-D-glucosaminyltransferase isoform X3 n=1 Tax=Oenanthe melanoleuca TaxID=2939378 RepID=UPI0024C1B8B0|nr:lactosylceramide 1,3-N-acetyl-beta-D-glucosaminyltransferase isoform X3 [Oenanthe melanoleuca]